MNNMSVFEIAKQNNYDLKLIKEYRFTIKIQEVFFRNDIYSFANNLVDSGEIKNNFLELFCLRFGDIFINSNFSGKEWSYIMEQLTIKPKSFYEMKELHCHDNKKNHSYKSDKFPTFEFIYTYPIYYETIEHFDFYNLFDKNMANKIIANARNSLAHCGYSNNYMSNNFSKPYLKNQPDQYFNIEETILCKLVDNENNIKENYIKNKINKYEYCKRMILIHGNFVREWPCHIAGYLTLNQW